MLIYVRINFWRQEQGKQILVIIPCPVYTNIERDSFLQGYIASHNII
jgi:hypothetical protein